MLKQFNLKFTLLYLTIITNHDCFSASPKSWLEVAAENSTKPQTYRSAKELKEVARADYEKNSGTTALLSPEMLAAIHAHTGLAMPAEDALKWVLDSRPTCPPITKPTPPSPKPFSPKVPAEELDYSYPSTE